MMEKIGGETDQDGFLVENFDLPVNLMLGCSMTLIKAIWNIVCKKFGEERGKADGTFA